MKILKNKQKILCIAGLLCISLTIRAQEFAFGAKAGVNIASIAFTDSDYSTKPAIGAHVGAFGNYNFTEKLSIQPEILFSTGGNKWTIEETDGKIKTSYISIPVLVQYHITDEIFAEAGPQYNFLLSIKQSIEGGENEDIKKYYKSGTFGFSIGAGYDLKALAKGLKATLRYSRDLTPMNDSNVDADKLKSSMIQIGASYTFSQ